MRPGLLVAACCAAHPEAAGAQAPGTAGAGASAGAGAGARDAPRANQREYDRTIRAALEEYALGHWDEAAALFARAHALNPSARTLRGLGLAAFESRSYALALGYMRAALADGRRPLTARQRQELERACARAQSFVARVELALQPAGASVMLDGNPAQLDAQRELLLDPGEHELLISAPGHEQRSVTVRAAGGTHHRLALQLRAWTDGATGAAAGAPSASGGLRYTWVAAAGVPVFGGLALGIWLSGQGELDDIEDGCRAAGGCSDDEVARRADDAGLSSRATWTSVCLMLTVASAATAATLFAIESGGDGEERAAGTAVAIGPGAVSLHGRF